MSSGEDEDGSPLGSSELESAGHESDDDMDQQSMEIEGGARGGAGHQRDKPQHSSKLTAEEADALQGEAVLGAEHTVMQLEVNELLAEARAQVPSAALAALDAEVAQLRKALALMRPHDVRACDMAPGFVRELGLDPQNTSLPFQPPLAVAAVGSGAARCTMAGPAPPSLDVALVIPPGCMFKKAYLNHRYHARRGLYLAAVAAQIRSSKTFCCRPMRWESCQQDPSRPVLVLSPPTPSQPSPSSNSKSASPHQFELRLMASLPPSTFPLAKLAPDRNAVRAVQQARPTGGPNKPAAQQQQQQSKEEGQETTLLPTPTYNTSVVADCCALLHAALLQFALQANPKLADGLLLLKVWARQHGLSTAQSADGLDGHMLAMLMVHLAERGKLSTSMTPLQMLRAALQALCDPVAGLPKGMAMTPQPPEQLFGAARAAAPILLAPFSPASSSHHGSAQASAAADALAHAACDGLPPSSTAPNLATFRKQASSSGSSVFIDPSGHCNLAAHMGRASLAAVTAAAKATLALLDAPADADEAVAAAFLTPASHASSADYVWAVAVADASAVSMKAHFEQQPGQIARKGEDDAGAPGLCRDRSAWRDAEATVETLARAALTDRATWVHAVRQPLQAAPVEHLQQGLLRPKAPGAVLLKARLDPTQALRLVDVGPAADDAKAAAKFRAFWGEASELRRFQDGKISEAVVWHAAQGARHTIPDRVLEYAFARHRPAHGPGTVLGCSSVLDAALRGHDLHSPLMPLGPAMGEQLGGSEDTDNVAITSARLVDAALVKLGKQLRSLEGLVLKVVGVQPQSSAIRQTNPCPPKPHPLASTAAATAGSSKKKGTKGGANGGVLGGGFEGGRLPRCLEPVDVLVQIENSGRWPSNPQAFKKMKAALGLQLAEALEKSYGLITQTSEDAVDVFVDGFAFRLTLYSGRDEALMARLASDMLCRPAPNAAPLPGATGQGGLSAGAASDAASGVSPESMPLIRNWHHGLVQAVGGANPAYAPTVRLAHRWLGAHLLSNHIAEEAVELLVAAAFTGPSACPPPGSRLTGFLRFLQLIARHPWGSRPLVVDPEHQLTSAQRSELQRRFDERRTASNVNGAIRPGSPGGLPAMYICTPRDPGSSHWTHSRPGQDALSHAVGLARRCYASLTAIFEYSAARTVAAAAPSRPATSPASAAAAAAPAVAELSCVALEAAFKPRLEDFDLLLTLRPEALPRAHNALPPAIAASTAISRRRRRQSDSLSAALDEEGPDKPPKRARAFLDAFPEKAIESRGPDALHAELLVGFDPLPPLLSALEERLGSSNPAVTNPAGSASMGHAGPLAALCADATGGQQVVGIKWAPAAFLPAPPRATSCHTALPCAATGLVAATPPSSSVAAAAAPLAVPNMVQILKEVQQVGEGIVDDGAVVRSCSKLPREKDCHL